MKPALSEPIHFIGIGGAGMSGIARVMLMRGCSVTGSDAKDSSVVTALRAQGAQINIGHSAEAVDGAGTVVVSSAIRESNPELAAARSKGIPVIHRSEALASLMDGYRTVAIAGTHGKTTTTSMATVALQACGADPSFVIGGVLTAAGTNAHSGTGDVFVAEADESDGSFLLYSPEIAVVTNVEADHLDHYGSWEKVREAFAQFAHRVEENGGVLIACADDAGSREVADLARSRGVSVITYGTSEDADVRIVDAHHTHQSQSFALETADGRSGPYELSLPGLYNLRNAAAALTIVAELGLDVDAAAEGLGRFGGTKRRFELKGTQRGVRVFDDYAHHPTELHNLLTAAKQVVDPERSVRVVFQPHLYSRTQNFRREFGEALGLADDVIVMDVYPAREDPIPGVTGAIVAAEVPLPDDKVTFVPSFAEVADLVAGRCRPGDVVITAGAGDVTIVGPEILDSLRSR